MPPIHFYDAANSHNVPSHVYAAVYINTRFAWSLHERDRMFKIISVSLEREAHWASLARCIDIENGAAGVADAVPFLQERRHLGFNDGTVYVNRSNREEVRQRCEHAGLHPYEWVSTLDGTMILDAWATQVHGGLDAPFDLSVLRGVDNFHTP